jgi:hypothetical protein
VLQYQQHQQSLQLEQFNEICDNTQIQQNLQNSQFVCVHPNCNKAFADKSRLERHKKIHTSKLTYFQSSLISRA